MSREVLKQKFVQNLRPSLEFLTNFVVHDFYYPEENKGTGHVRSNSSGIVETRYENYPVFSITVAPTVGRGYR